MFTWLASVVTAAIVCLCGPATVQMPAVRVDPPIARVRTWVIGDSIGWNICQEGLAPNATCINFPGAWVASETGENQVDPFITRAVTEGLHAGDTVILSSIAAYLTPACDAGCVTARQGAMQARFADLGVRLVVLVAPLPTFPNCSPAALAVAPDVNGSCSTQLIMSDIQHGWCRAGLARCVTITGPYEVDGRHPTATANVAIAAALGLGA
ncbi:MAG: hypothetical protein JWM34_3528 [Ilumatobacteraceae bacterium]|nr:hypothetical protein [Ilumatobacteraceae bacterium]